jgi:hypothetical protein
MAGDNFWVERSHLPFSTRQIFHEAWLIVKAENEGYLLGIDGEGGKWFFLWIP